MMRWLTALVAAFVILAGGQVSAETLRPSPGRIAALVAPIALYPDALLMPLLMASTYPAELGEAAQWLKPESNSRLRGDALVAALEPRPWAPSVKALVPFPDTLIMAASRPEWSAVLGKAFAADPVGVMAAVQMLRHKAVAAGKLVTTPRLVVRTEGAAVIVAPADPAVVYIPVYNPGVVYGAWGDAENPPKFIEPPHGFRVSGADIDTGIGFSVGFSTLAPLWGWSHPDWSAGTIAIDIAAYNRINRYGPHASAATWAYEPHPTGYFHITAAQVTALPAPRTVERAPAKHAASAAAKKHEKPHREARGSHRPSKPSRHAAKHDRHDRRHAAAPAHRGKIRVAAEHHRH